MAKKIVFDDHPDLFSCSESSEHGVKGARPLCKPLESAALPLPSALDFKPNAEGFGLTRYIHEVTSRFDQETGEILSLKPTSSDTRRERFKLLDISSGILTMFYGDEPILKPNGHPKKHRTSDCHRTPLGTFVQVFKSETNSKSFFSGVLQCASVWTCPVCGSKISERKASEMRIAFNQSIALGLLPHLVTFTAPHQAGDRIEDLASKIREALASFWRERQVKNWKSSRHVVGNIRSFEVRYGKNGWHPHFHLIVFSKQSLLSDTSLLLDKWQACCLRAGLDMPNKYGLDIQDGSKAGEYICKFGSDGDVITTSSGKPVTWDAADEMTKSNAKKGKKDSLSPWDLLRCSENPESDVLNISSDPVFYRTLFLFYSRAMKGVNQIKWSRGLRDIFALTPEMTDEQIVAQQDDSAKVLCHLTISEWRYLISKSLRPTILDLAENGGSEAVARFLHGTTGAGTFEDFYKSFLNRHASAL